MASAKKGKKNKGKTLALIDFLQETPGSVPTIPIRKSTVNWADEVEDNHDVYDSRSAKTSLVLPTAPKASRDFDDIIDKVPQDPPFIAYLTNLPYDVDENEISYFFKNMKIANMRIPKDERPGEMPKLKGFGYVEFEDRDSLLNALVIPDTTLKNRRIRIEIATDYDFDKRRSGRMDMNRDRSGRSDVSMGDWRSGPRQENTDTERRGFSRDRERDDSSGAWREGRSNRENDRGFTRSSDRFRGEDRGGEQEFSRGPREERSGGSFMSREDRGSSGGGAFMSREDRGNAGGGERSGGSFMSREDRGNAGGGERSGGSFMSREDRGGAGGERGGERSGGSFMSREDRGGAGGERSGGGGGERGGAYMARRYDRDDRRNGGFSRNPRDSDSREADSNKSDESRQRPKLVLTPRTKPVENEPEKAASTTSIFGNAKPVDTSARERQIEERLLAKDEAPPKREQSRERKESLQEKESVVVPKEKKEKDRVSESEKKSVVVEKEKIPASQNQKNDLNGVVDKEKAQPQKRNGDPEKKEPVKADIVVEKHNKPEVKKREEKKEKAEKEMPKMKKAEPPNFISSNAFAYLQTDDNSD